MREREGERAERVTTFGNKDGGGAGHSFTRSIGQRETCFTTESGSLGEEGPMGTDDCLVLPKRQHSLHSWGFVVACEGAFT